MVISKKTQSFNATLEVLWTPMLSAATDLRHALTKMVLVPSNLEKGEETRMKGMLKIALSRQTSCQDTNKQAVPGVEGVRVDSFLGVGDENVRVLVCA